MRKSKKIFSVALVLLILFNLAGCACMPSKKALEAMDEKQRVMTVANIEMPRYLWQGVGTSLGLFAGIENYKANPVETNLIMGASGALIGLGITSLVNLASYKENETEKTYMLSGLVLATTGVLVTMLVKNNEYSAPGWGMLFTMAIPFVTILGGLAGAGLGAVAGKIAELFTGGE